MKIPAGKIDRYVKELPATLLGALVYGPDVGLTSLRAQAIARKIVPDLTDPFRVVEFAGDSLAESSTLADELAAIGAGGLRRLVWIKDTPAGLGRTIAEAFATARPQADQVFLLATAGELAASASLRKWFEATANVTALPCYQDDAASLSPVIAEALRARGLACDQDVIPFLQEHCRGDRLIVLGEIEKLALYLGKEKRVTFDDARASVGDTTEASFGDLCRAVADGDQAALERHLRRALWQGLPPVALLRATQRYFSRLHLVSGHIAGGAGTDEAIARLTPPVFFKELPAFRRHVLFWSGTRRHLWQALALLYDAELACKRTGADAELLCSRFLMRVAALRNVRAAA